ncbi:MAG: hypothetical protein WCK26_02290 [Candidatus Saccharibacteria bacterium]
MDHLEQFRGTYDINRQRLERRINMLVVATSQFVPDNLAELIALSENGEIDFPLEWVKVPDPSSGNEGPNLEVLPVLEMWKGEDNETGPCLSGLTIFGKLSDGEERVIGSMNPLSGKNTPMLYLNVVGYTEWESADAEIFLKLAESSLESQEISE